MASSILIVGAGPVGLSLALGLAVRGVRADIVDGALRPSPYCRALGVSPRTLEQLDAVGVARELIAEGLRVGLRRAVLHRGEKTLVQDEPIAFPDLPFAPFCVPQDRTEAVLERALQRAGVEVGRGTKLLGLEEGADARTVTLQRGEGIERQRYDYVVGCDGAHSVVRKALGLAFEGEAFPYEFMLGDVHIDWDLARGATFQAIRPAQDAPPDFFVAIPLPGRGRYRVSMMAPTTLDGDADRADTGHGIQSEWPGPSLAQLQEVADQLVPGKPTLSDLRWSSIFRISMRLAEHYRKGNVLIAGDACHIHPPTGGQGMNTGIQDACNLAWKLALVARGEADPTLLDSYEEERQPVAAGVIEDTVRRSVGFGKPAAPQHRLHDTQVLVSYAGGRLASGPASGALRPGDRLPDATGLRQAGIGFPLRLHELAKGPWFTLLAAPAPHQLAELEGLAARLQAKWPGLVSVVAFSPADATWDEPPGVTIIADPDGSVAAAFGGALSPLTLVRPDGHIGFTGEIAFDPLRDYLSGMLKTGSRVPAS
ncbi:FAD-dependent monooxygenase [Bosea sp. BH3]|uniref:FAD-dependent monooxygenase n=1 Tax=Bosea sp. BH3 TaxID=2871701 RepID=UPI0021CAF5AF|nr:FAD-dependent monooxygenase [Bosea sp. BH3]MCU4179098.1 FAD-dependent monooxygenase [Bosea sp. BH3]